MMEGLEAAGPSKRIPKRTLTDQPHAGRNAFKATGFTCLPSQGCSLWPLKIRVGTQSWEIRKQIAVALKLATIFQTICADVERCIVWCH